MLKAIKYHGSNFALTHRLTSTLSSLWSLSPSLHGQICLFMLKTIHFTLQPTHAVYYENRWQNLADPADLPCGWSDCIVILSSGVEDPDLFGVEVSGPMEQNSGLQELAMNPGRLNLQCLKVLLSSRSLLHKLRSSSVITMNAVALKEARLLPEVTLPYQPRRKHCTMMKAVPILMVVPESTPTFHLTCATLASARTKLWRALLMIKLRALVTLKVLSQLRASWPASSCTAATRTRSWPVHCLNRVV